jgi:hypothetical protein
MRALDLDADSLSAALDLLALRNVAFSNAVAFLVRLAALGFVAEERRAIFPNSRVVENASGLVSKYLFQSRALAEWYV